MVDTLDDKAGSGSFFASGSCLVGGEAAIVDNDDELLVLASDRLVIRPLASIFRISRKVETFIVCE